ncbi:hypothetical protein GCM10027271_04850 [Saccharopolyspora gloriosae]
MLRRLALAVERFGGELRGDLRIGRMHAGLRKERVPVRTLYGPENTGHPAAGSGAAQGIPVR